MWKTKKNAILSAFFCAFFPLFICGKRKKKKSKQTKKIKKIKKTNKKNKKMFAKFKQSD